MKRWLWSAVLFLTAACPAWAQGSVPVSDIAETAFIFNTVLFLWMGLWALFVLFGFSLLEAGQKATRSPGMILTRNVLFFAVTSLLFFSHGYMAIYAPTLSFDLLFWYPQDNAALVAADYSARYAAGSDWFFQLLLVSMVVWIVGYGLSGRLPLFAQLFLVIIIAGGLYPLVARWIWGHGWLNLSGFRDFSGAASIHSLAGWIVVWGLIVTKRYTNAVQPTVEYMAPGAVLLWIGLLASYSGSHLALGSAVNAVAVSNIMVNSVIAMSGGVLASFLLYILFYRRVYLPVILRGALGGMIALAGEPLLPTLDTALLIGVIGGAIVVILPLMLPLRHAVPAAVSTHWGCGIWASFAVLMSHPQADFMTQAEGVGAVAAISLVIMVPIFLIVRVILRYREQK